MSSQIKSNFNGKNGTHSPKLVYPSASGVLFQGDCLALLGKTISESVDLVFADPPFNLGKHYGTETFDDKLATWEYRKWCQTWLMEMTRVLRPGGALFLYHWPFWLIELGAWLNTLPTVEFRSWIALKMKAGFPIRNRIHPAHYGILYYTKSGAKPTFNVVRHRAPICRHCNGEIRDYGGYRKKFNKYEDDSGVPWIQISDFWEDTRPERSTKSRPETINELPMHVPERVILMATNPGDIVLDVFGGSGSTFHAAQASGRKWIGCDIAEVDTILRRVCTCFGLRPSISDAKNILNRCFKADFVQSSKHGFLRDGELRLNQVVPFEDREAPSFHRMASKSKTLGF